MNNNNKTVLTCALLGIALSPNVQANSQLTDNTPKLTALTQARLMLEPGKQLDNATLLIENNKIKAIIKDNDVPQGAYVINLQGYTIYPGFIDPFTEYGIDFEYPEQSRSGPVTDIKRIGGNAENGAIHSQQNWVDYIYPDKEDAKTWINNGFTSVQTAIHDGIFRGRAATVSLADKKANDVIYNAKSSHFMAFDKGSSIQDYPNSLMGSIALIRQTFSDVNWYKNNIEKAHAKQAKQTIEYNAALANLTNIDNEQVLFETRNLNNLLRASQLLKGAKIKATLVGNGREYARINEIKANQYSLVLPLDFPAAPNIADADSERDIPLANLRHWEQAPSNLGVVAQSGVPFAVTQHGIEAEDFWPRIRQAINAGLTEQQALAALTTDAAEMVGTADFAGKLKAGYTADFVIAKGNLFVDGDIHAVWLQGKPQQLIDSSLAHLNQQYLIQLNELNLSLDIDVGESLSGALSSGEQSISLNDVNYQSGRLTFTANLTEAGYPGVSRFTLWFDEQGVRGRMLDANNQQSPLAGIAAPKPVMDLSENDEQAISYVSTVTSPNVAYGLTEQPKFDKVHIKNATVWTSTEAGILENHDVIITRGKIDEIGASLKTPSGYRVIDANGKHITAGIIDEHSHIAINGGTNEATDAITSEVRIGDILDPDAIALYRALAGGVTTAQLLHGSANPIGGQAQVIKTRWGATAEQLKMTQAPRSIKFALGENVKQSNWGDDYDERFPQTRMGVKSLFEEAFNEAKAYRQAKREWSKLRSSEKRRQIAPRPNYRLDALVEVLADERDIHIHSYVQSEILMFLRLAEAYGFTANTFTHILEGYKVAQEMAEHGANASTFSDWWAYKFEVYDAIPQNTCLMQNKGVLTSINSDDYEMQRRLNQEAAKSMMYCGMSATDAWNMVTINPAIQLGIDEYVGSVEKGKHADIVLWSDNPLSVYATVESTWVDGKQYFNKERDRQAQKAINTERAALIQKILNRDESAELGTPEVITQEPEWHCDTHYNAWGQSHAGEVK
ncbi:amidohydrolase family protein [Shewanella waksmanii]|uniref:amidohydrolase family protein n=1 Tax=Shewanella waksmanii TaxID=213783 RepID=UPI0037356AEC